MKAYGQITISNVVNGQDGQSAINVVLGNESQNIPCTNNGVVPEQMIIDIEFNGYLGTKKVPTSVAVGILPSGVTLASNISSTSTENGLIKLNIAKGANLGGNNVLNGNIKLTFTIEKQQIIKEFSWCKTKDGAEGSMTIYELNSSTPVLNKEINNIIKPNTITLKAQSRKNNSTSYVDYNGIFIIKESEDGATYTTKYTSSINENIKIYTISSNNLKYIQCILCEAGKVSNQLDVVTIPVLSDESIKNEIQEVKTTINGVSSKVDAVENSITNKVWQTDITTQINNYDGSTIKKMRDQIAEQKIEMGSITNKVSDVESKFSNDLHSLTERVAQNELTADGFKQTVEKNYATKTEMNTAVNKVQVGGRNYVLRKNDKPSISNGITVEYLGDTFHIHGTNTKTDEAYGVGNWVYRPEQILTPGERYIFSITNPLPKDMYVSLNSWFNPNTGKTGQFGCATINADGSTSVSFVLSNESSGGISGFFGIRPTTKTIDVKIQIKLEKGNKPTDWTPAPEDTYQEIENVKSSIDQKANEIITNVEKNYTTKTELGNVTTTLRSEIKQSADSINQTVSDLQGNISTHTQKINSLESSVSSAQGEISSVKQTANSVKTEVEAARGGKTSLNVRLGGIETIVNDNKGNISSLQQTSSELSTKVQNNSGDISNLQQKATDIELSVSNVSKNLASNYYNKTQTDAKIKVESDKIDLTVSKVEAVQKEAITSTIEEFYLSTSPTSLLDGNWSEVQPVWTQGKYIWRRSKVTKGNGTFSYTPNENGVCISGNTGAIGATGVGIKSITNYYLATSKGSNITVSSEGWTTTIQSMSVTNKYLWNYEKITYTNNSTFSTIPCIIGAYGDKGQVGDTGNGISNIEEYYQISTSNTTPPTSWVTTVPTLTATNKYLWNYEKITYTNGTTKETAKRVIGVYGDKGQTGDSGKGIKSTVITYQAGTSGTTAPTGTWGSTVPSVPQGQYLWSKTVITYTDNTTSTTYSVAYIPKNGATGGTGATGTGVESIIQQYYLSTSKTSQTGGSWVTSMPTWTRGKYLWTRYQINYKNPTSIAYTSPICDSSWEVANDVQADVEKVRTEYKAELKLQQESINSTVSRVDVVEEAVGNAQSSADKAQGTANSVNNRVTVAESQIKQLSDSISTMVTDEKGSSLMTQTSQGWTFNIGGIQKTLSDTMNNLNRVESDVNTAGELLNSLQNITNDISKKTAYIDVTTVNGQPAIVLGQSNNSFRLRITNTSIDFLDGSSRVAYISNKVLYIEKAIIKDELQIGDGIGYIWKRRSNGNLGLRYSGKK